MKRAKITVCVLIVVTAATVAAIITIVNRLDEIALAALAGATCGLAAAVPSSIAAWFAIRRTVDRDVRPLRPPSPSQPQPPQVVVLPSAPQPAQYYESSRPVREYRVVGADGETDGTLTERR